MSSFRFPTSILVLLTTLGVGCAEETIDRPALEIFIDQNGVPHIYGQTDREAFYGAGYQQAHDRLFHMDQIRRRAYGRLSEIHGSSTLEDDEIARQFDWPGWGNRHAEAMQAENQETWVLLEAWVEGVNLRIGEIEGGEAELPYGFGPEELDYQPEMWIPEDILVIATMTGFGNDLSFDREVFAQIAEQYFPEAMGALELLKPARSVFTVPDEDRLWPDSSTPRSAPAPEQDVHGSSFGTAELEQAVTTAGSSRKLRALRRLHTVGSNNWAVDGRFTESGRPMIAGDPHLGYDVPGMFYALHINSKDGEGSINAAGFSFAGTPGISVGHTDSVVWTPTTAFADVMDVWTVQLPDANHVAVGGQTVELAIREEVIDIRAPGKPAGEGNQQSYQYLDVPGYGVILTPDLIPIPVGEPDDRLLLNWIGYKPNPFKGLLDFNRVESIDEYDEAVDGFGGNFNFVAADVDGITYRAGVRVPVRDVSGGRTPWLVLDGKDPGSLWTDARLPTEQLPHGRAEQRGWLATANNDPFGFTADGDVSNDPWYYGGFFAPGWRAGRIMDELGRITAQGNLTIEDMQALQQDVHSNLADDLVPLFGEAWARVATSEALAEFRDRPELETLASTLLDWDRQMVRASSGAVVFHAFAHFLTRRVLEDDMQFLFYQAMDLQPVFILKLASMAMRGEYPAGDEIMQDGRDPLLMAALSDTADYLVERFGSVDPSAYQYGDIAVSNFEHATGTGVHRGTFPTDGGESSVNVRAEGTFFDQVGGVTKEWSSPYGPIFRHVATFAEDGTPELYFNIPLGNVVDPASPHYQDLHEDWIEGRYRKMLYRRGEVEEAAERHFLLEPLDGVD